MGIMVGMNDIAARGEYPAAGSAEKKPIHHHNEESGISNRKDGSGVGGGQPAYAST